MSQDELRSEIDALRATLRQMTAELELMADQLAEARRQIWVAAYELEYRGASRHTVLPPSPHSSNDCPF